MFISTAQSSDLEPVNALLHDVLDLHARLRPDLFISGTKKYTDEELLAIFSNPNTPVFVAKDEQGSLLGYCFCELQERSGSGARLLQRHAECLGGQRPGQSLLRKNGLRDPENPDGENTLTKSSLRIGPVAGAFLSLFI